MASGNSDFLLKGGNFFMEVIKEFVVALNNINLSKNPRLVSSELFNELETLDVDLKEKLIKNNKYLTDFKKKQLIDLIEFYYSNIEKCINVFSQNEIKKFLEELTTKANEVYSYIKQLK